MIYVVLSFAIHLVSLIGLDHVSDDVLLTVYDFSDLIQQLLLCMGVYKLLPVRSYRYKAFMIVFIFLSLWNVLELSYLTFANGYVEAVQSFSDYLLLLIFVFVFCNFLLRKPSGFSDYKSCGTFIVYRSGKSLQGYLTSLFTDKGQCMLVVDGIEYKFKDGVIIERKHVHKTIYSYKRVQGIRQEEARSLLGKKWSLFNNCFSVFEKFGDSDRARYNSAIK